MKSTEGYTYLVLGARVYIIIGSHYRPNAQCTLVLHWCPILVLEEEKIWLKRPVKLKRPITQYNTLIKSEYRCKLSWDFLL